MEFAELRALDKDFRREGGQLRAMAFPRPDLRRLVNMPLVLIPVSLLLAYYVGKSAVHPQPNLWFLIAFLVVSVVITKNPKSGIFVILISVFLLDWLNRTFLLLPRQLTWLKDASILILLVRTFTLVAKEKIVEKTPIDVLLFLFLTVGFFSTVVNGVSPIVAGLGFRPVLKYLLLFYVIVNSHFDEKFLKKVLGAFLFIGFAQIPVSILESVLWHEGLLLRGAAMNRWDFVTGTLPRGSSGVVSIFVVGVICMLIGLGIYHRSKLKALLGSLLLFIPLPLTVARGTLIALPWVLLYMLGRKFRKAFGLRFAYALLLGLTFLTSIYIGSTATGYNLMGYVKHPVAALKEQTRPIQSGSVGRISGIGFVFDYLREHPYGRLLGVGPGVWSESFFGEFSGKLWTEFEDMPVSRINQISAIMSEFGVLGLVLFLLMIFRVYRMNDGFFLKVKDDWWRSISFGFSGIIFLYCISTVYLSVWYQDGTALFFWVLAAAVFSVGREKGIH